MVNPQTTLPPPPRPPRPSRRWSLIVLVVALVSAGIKIFFGNLWGLAAGLPATLFAAVILYRGWVYPRLYRHRRLAVLGLLISGSFTYAAFSRVALSQIYRQTFQLTHTLATYQDADGWRVSYPRLWSHETQGVSGITNHIFKPSKTTPTMFFAVATRPNAGTSDLDLVVQGFFMNLPKEGDTLVTEREYVLMPNGQRAYRAVYTDLTRQNPIKNEILLTMDNTHLYVLSVGGAPQWFDRHRPYLETLLYSLSLTSSTVSSPQSSPQ